MLKQLIDNRLTVYHQPAAFGRLCVETKQEKKARLHQFQPPSGGCVLKLVRTLAKVGIIAPAAFGRLCVETSIETAEEFIRLSPAAFGRLCVETLPCQVNLGIFHPSRLRAAVC